MDASEALRQGAGAIPTVLLNPEVQVGGCDSLSIDNVGGARAIVAHLIALGHRRIATVTGPAGNIDAHQRLEGHRMALRDARLEPSASLELRGDFTERSGYEAGMQLVSRRPRPTAVFVANDPMAVGVLGALQDAGVEVPRAMAVAGFDDIPMARYLTPPLTTIHVDMLALGQRAVHLLTTPCPDRTPRRETVPTTLVVRASCGSAPPSQAGSRPRWERRHAVSMPRRGGAET
ncbi:MAG: LacI family transcriptional regulator [Candidatus Eisenbacteria bacterium]|uniref:LacI family transcriptional regulator n=1 Tax=Eiseniibacteriota bacterium TaxID=2212470 RepID=A0A538U1G9_UNCEI|nr:MAG: LacI family transcriptional regulator [Candidatus Eisenbacteria bacterium]